jgi:hypothetical protein
MEFPLQRKRKKVVLRLLWIDAAPPR